MGSIANLNEYLAFRIAHGIDDKSYKDLYIGDYFTIIDGTYNAEWMVAHFDYYWNIGDSNSYGSKGVVLIPRSHCAITKMYASGTDAVDGYKGSIPNTTTCPAIASALSTVLGSYLLNIRALVSNAMDPNIASIAGAGLMGASTGWEWITTQCVLPSEVQIYGSNVTSSSFYDTGEAYNKLAIFNFITTLEYAKNDSVWLKNVASSAHYAFIYGHGYAYYAGITFDVGIRPLIYIG